MIKSLRKTVCVLFACSLFVLLSLNGLAESGLKAKSEAGGEQIVVTVKAGKFWEDKWPIFLFINKTTTPQVAIWIEDTNGNFLETIYVSKKAATQGWVGMGNIRRKSSLPYWAHRRGVKYEDGIYLPTSDDPLPDAYTGATPAGDFSVNTLPNEKIPHRIKIFAEFNSSGNFNDDYPEGDFFGQPSVVYSEVLNLTKLEGSQKLKLIGHGHPSGESGELFNDLGKLTTALDIVEEITVKLNK